MTLNLMFSSNFLLGFGVVTMAVMSILTVKELFSKENNNEWSYNQ